MRPERILIVEDDDALLRITRLQLEREGYEVSSAASAEEAILLLNKGPYHLVIADLNLPGISGIDLLKVIRLEHPETIVVVMTAYATVQTAVESMKCGAYDYLTKPIHAFDLKMLVQRSLEHQKLLHEVEALRSTLDRKQGFDEIIGSSAVLLQTLDIAAQVAATDVTVLICGETGTGKELVARAIHSRSTRRTRPFVTVNCGAIPRELLESELFGYVKGAFTGALSHKKGKIEAADGGTVFLDEIGEMPLELQTHILRLIQEREVEKIGASTATKVDVRILAATHRDLASMVRQGLFREDLYYRLLVVPIRIPALRERPGDIEKLVQHFFVKFRAKYGRVDLSMKPEVIHYLCEFPWPGNVRQLENAMERMVLLTRGQELTATNLPDFLVPAAPSGSPPASSAPLPVPVSENPTPRPSEEPVVNLRAFEKNMILHALKQCAGNQTITAGQLGISRRTLAYRLKKYGIEVDTLKAMKHGA
jgi:DNA-binding NtrC family response regulator